MALSFQTIQSDAVRSNYEELSAVLPSSVFETQPWINSIVDSVNHPVNPNGYLSISPIGRYQWGSQGHDIAAIAPRIETQNSNPPHFKNEMASLPISEAYSPSLYDTVPWHCVSSNIPAPHPSMGDLSHQRLAGCASIPPAIYQSDQISSSNTMLSNPWYAYTRRRSRLFQCKWQDCSYDKAFSSLSTLWRHIQSTHISPSEYTCPECGKEFGLGRGDKLRSHMKVAHPNGFAEIKGTVYKN
ncbi:hypothetical protein PENSTE_c004G00165 [Penicillium steckii]|uniref:C2H2-type domain-containing protein n=1 Tax=Penicillium steckii TaxID=303698 RepID=A0A1V6TMN1_9EURO|nr:hypothetical protein PENSTE_c004G00165 [Penicillium steckii]